MTTLREKLDQKWAEGCEAFVDIVHAKVGNARINGDESSVYYVDLVHRARRLLLDLGELRSDLLDFGSLSATGPSAEERKAQRQLDLDDANAAAIAREKAAAKAEEPAAVVEGEDPDVELERFMSLESDPAGECEELEGEIDEELERLGVSVFNIAVRPLEGELWAHLEIDGRSIRIMAARAREVLVAIKEESPAPPDASHVVAEALAAVAPASPPRVPAPDLDPGLEAVEGELTTELDRVLGDDNSISADVARDPVTTAILVDAGHADEDEAKRWSIVREAPRVLGALRQLPDGAGAEAVRAILCGLAETAACTCGAAEDDLGVVVHADDCELCGVVNDEVEGDAQADAALKAWVDEPGEDPEDPDDQVEADIIKAEQAIGAELTRCGADGVEVLCGAIDTADAHVITVHLSGNEWSHDGPSIEALYALTVLPDDCGEAAVKARLLREDALPPPPAAEDLPGRAAGEPAKRRARKAKGEATA